MAKSNLKTDLFQIEVRHTGLMNPQLLAALISERAWKLDSVEFADVRPLATAALPPRVAPDYLPDDHKPYVGPSPIIIKVDSSAAVPVMPIAPIADAQGRVVGWQRIDDNGPDTIPVNPPRHRTGGVITTDTRKRSMWRRFNDFIMGTE